MFDAKLSGEAYCQPHLRIPPLRTNFLKKLCSAFHKAHDVASELKDGDLYLFSDGGRHGNEGALMSTFTYDGKKIPTVSKKLYVVIEEESLKARRNRLKKVPTRK